MGNKTVRAKAMGKGTRVDFLLAGSPGASEVRIAASYPERDPDLLKTLWLSGRVL